MSCYLDHEISRISSVRELLKFHDDTVTAIDSLRVKVEKMEAQPNAKIDQLQEAKKQLDVKKMQLSAFYKGFYFFTLPINSKLKSQNIRKMVANVGSTMLVTSHTLLTSSKQLLRELFISPTQAISDASQILDLLSLKPLDEPPEGLPGPNEGLDTSPPWVEALYYSALQSITAPGFLPSPPMYTPSSPGKTTTSSPASSPAAVAAPDPTNQLFSSAPAKSSNPFDNVDDVVSGPSIGAGAETKKSTNPFDDNNSSKNEIKITPVEPVRVNRELLGDLIGDESKKENKSIWG